MMKKIIFLGKFILFCLFKKRIIAAIDISGSIGSDNQTPINAMLHFASRFLGCDILVLLFNHDIVSVSSYNAKNGGVYADDVDITRVGGTDCNPVFDYARGYRYAIEDSFGLVIFTDGYLPPPGYSFVKTKSLWVIAPCGAELNDSYPGKAIYA